MKQKEWVYSDLGGRRRGSALDRAQGTAMVPDKRFSPCCVSRGQSWDPCVGECWGVHDPQEDTVPRIKLSDHQKKEGTS